MSNTDSFIDEVTEEVRKDKMYALVRKYGWVAALVVVLIVGGAAYNEYRKASLRQEARALGDAMLAALEGDTPSERVAALAQIDTGTPEGGAVLAFLSGAEQAAADNPLAAAETMEALALENDLPLIYRQIATFKALTLRSSDMPASERRAGFEALASPTVPLRALAEEQLALIDIEEGDIEGARARLTRLISDAQSPPGLQQRALQVIIALGGEDAASDAAPETDQ